MKEINNSLRTCIVWVSRILAGGVFTFSGFAKAIDPWGSIFQIEQYLSIWEVQQPRSLVLIITIILCCAEFLLGVSMLFGMYRRSVPKIALIFITFFLILTGYILIYSPVDDCGCFGDALKLSNAATFIKNIILCVLIVCLIIWGKAVRGVYAPMVQWVVGVVSLFYVLLIAVIGYLFQPLLDFRPFKEGSSLIDDSVPEIEFIYSKEGKEQIFNQDNLPSERDGWTYIGRREKESSVNPLTIENGEGDDVTDEVLTDAGRQLMILIPEIRRADISATMYLNRLNAVAANDGVDVVALIGTDNPRDIEWWKDVSMAAYPIYMTDGTQLKTIARGETSLVYIVDGKIRHKRSMAMMSNGGINNVEQGKTTLESLFILDNRVILYWITGVYAIVLLILFFLSLPSRLRLRRMRLAKQSE